MSNTNENTPHFELNSFEGHESFNKDEILEIGSEDEYSDTDNSGDNSQEETGDSETGTDDDLLSQQNLLYFQNMDQLLSNYFSSEDTNIVNAIQGLEKTLKEFSAVMRESMEQNAKCTLRVAKVLEAAATVAAQKK